MAKAKALKEVVTEVKSGFNKDVCDKIIATCEYLMAPVAVITAGVAAIWGYSIDITAYSVAFFGMISSVFSFVKLFLKD